VKLLRDDFKSFRLNIKSSSENSNKIDYHCIEKDKNIYQVYLTPRSIERNYLQLYFDDELANIGKSYFIF
jgi:hypothetical protein